MGLIFAGDFTPSPIVVFQRVTTPLSVSINRGKSGDGDGGGGNQKDFFGQDSLPASV